MKFIFRQSPRLLYSSELQFNNNNSKYNTFENNPKIPLKEIIIGLISYCIYINIDKK